MNFFTLFFYILLILGSLVSISSSSLWGVWIGLEINFLPFIPLISSFKSSFLNEAAIKYFILQALPSSILLFFFLLSRMIIPLNFILINILVCSAVFLKVGAAPFHFWFPEVIERLSWFISFILITWEKLAPTFIIRYFSSYKSSFFSIITFFLLFWEA